MKALLQLRKEIDIAAWDALVAGSPQGSVFVYSWYLDIITPGWQAITIYEGDVLAAVFPLWMKKKYFLTVALQPVLAKYWGVCFSDKKHKNAYEEYNWKKNILEAAISAIPKELLIFSFNFHPTFDYPLPFSWDGYLLQAKYTFRLDLQPAFEEIQNNYLYKVRSAIKKAQKEGIGIKEDTSAENLSRILKLNSAQGKAISTENDNRLMAEIFKEARKRNACFSLTAWLNDETAIASSLFIYDDKCVYYIIGTLDPAYKHLHAMQLLTSEGIRKAKELVPCFDFLGVSIKPIEFFFRRFGPKPVPYLNISKSKIPFLKL